MNKKLIKISITLIGLVVLANFACINNCFAIGRIESWGNENTNFNRYNSMVYQDTYYSSHNPKYEYIDGANCTNWASQTVLAGGMSEISSYSPLSKHTDIRNWYYQPKNTILDRRCETFVCADQFRQHWGVDIYGQGNRRAAYTMMTTIEDWYNNWDYYGSKCNTGDILQMYYPGENEPHHSMVVYYTDMDEEGYVYEITITENTRDAKTGFAEIFLREYQNNPDAIIGLIKITEEK